MYIWIWQKFAKSLFQFAKLLPNRPQFFTDLWSGGGTFFVGFKLSSRSSRTRRPEPRRSILGSGESHVWQHLVLFTIDIRLDGKAGVVSTYRTKKSCWTQSGSKLSEPVKLLRLCKHRKAYRVPKIKSHFKNRHFTPFQIPWLLDGLFIFGTL